MADLSTLYPQQQGGDLYRSGDFVGFDQRNQQFDDARRNNAINQQGALAAQLYEQQMNPLKLQQQDLQNQTLGAQLPGHVARSTISSNDAKLSTDTLDSQRKSLLAKYAAETSDAELKDNQNRIKELMTHPSAQMREVGKWLWEMTDEIQKYKLGLESKETVAKTAANKPQRPVSGPKAPATFEETFAKLRKNHERYGALQTEATRIEADDPQRAQLYRQMAETIRPLAEAELQTAPKPGSVDVAGATGDKVPTAPNRDIRPPNNPLAANPAPGQVSDPVRKAVVGAGWSYEPDKYEYRVGPNGQPQRRKKQ